jgi:drug/metabolite transporter (DMT)-like permease
VNVLRHKLNGLDPLAITSFALLFIGLPMGAYLFTTDFVERTLSEELTDGFLFPAVPVSAVSFTAIFLLGVLGTAISTVMFNKLIQRSGALVASSVTYLIPIVAACWGFADGESIGVVQIGGLGLILTGVYIINIKK